MTERSARPPSTPRGPQRTCVGCRQRTDRSQLLRLVAGLRDDVPVVLPDARACQPGRGAWIHPDPDCLALAERRRAFTRALREQGPLDASAVRVHLQQAPPPPSTSNRKRDIT